MKVEGLRELRQTLSQLPAEIKRDKIVVDSLKVGARLIQGEAKRLAPVLREPTPLREAGALRSGITLQVSKEEDLTVAVRVRTRGYIFAPGLDSNRNRSGSHRSGNPNYWWLVEFGTSKMAAQPFMRPAFESRKMDAMSAIIKDLAPRIAKAASSLARRFGMPQGAR